MSIETVKAVLFDTFGTIVDWRSSIAAEADKIAQAKGIENFDGDAFARAWRAGYRPGMARVTSGEREWVAVDVIHRERLDEILPEFGLDMLTEEERADLNLAWHRIRPWPDSVPGLIRLKSKYLISPLSNGSLVLLATMGKQAGIPWDFVFSSDMHKAYKRNPAVYRNAIALLGFEPGYGELRQRGCPPLGHESSSRIDQHVSPIPLQSEGCHGSFTKRNARQPFDGIDQQLLYERR